MSLDKEKLLRSLAEFFLDSLREDAEDVNNWCIQGENGVDEIVNAMETYLDGMSL